MRIRQAADFAKKEELLLEDKLRAQLKAKSRERTPHLDMPAGKRPRVNKKLQSCPGIREPSASGKIMRPLPQIWKKEMKEETEYGILMPPPSLDSTFTVPKTEDEGKLLFHSIFLFY